MTYETIIVRQESSCMHILLNRIDSQNTINLKLLRDLHEVLDSVENDPQCHMIMIEGQKGIFSTGMDFAEMAQMSLSGDKEKIADWTESYMSLLKRFASTAKIIISKVDGKALAGGIGFAVASDLVLATPGSTFSLSEALWGLLPAMVAPFLIRRVGFQKAYALTLTSQTISAKEAFDMHLVDVLLEDGEVTWQKLRARLFRLEEPTVANLKSYFRKMWIVNEAMEATAVEEIMRLIQDPHVKKNIQSFVEHHQFPWEKR